MLRVQSLLVSEVKLRIDSFRLSSTSFQSKDKSSSTNAAHVAERVQSDEDKYSEHEFRTIYGEKYPIWHKPLSERPEEFKSRFAVLGFDKIGVKLIEPTDRSLSLGQRFLKWFSRHTERMQIEDQVFNPSRHEILGNDLATAHFICYRGGAVRFVNSNKWIKQTRGKMGYEVELSPKYIPGLFIEAVDCEHFKDGIRYEGLENLVDLQYLTWLSFKNTKRFDNWSLDRISNIVNKTVEYLDLRGTKIDYRGLNAMYRFENLKLLLVDFKHSNEENEAVEDMLGRLQEYHKGLLIKKD